jgi:DNA-binding transcriptional ArsR family regulator
MASEPDEQDQAGRFAYEGLDRVIHEKARLGILASLAAHQDGLTFNDLKQACALTDGNLSRHLAVLGEADLVEARKGSGGARPQTRYRLSAAGRRRFTEYIDVLRSVVADAQVETRTERERAPPSLFPRAGESPSSP